ncbi:PSME3-interacting protein isoform X1 [Paramormyrops kingsleyae]|uniref:PSME3-interacting protein isoform X1 n=1 Tax=Paramormyrops kingsleyae TaxID=1676925 RepID=UPI003B96C751
MAEAGVDLSRKFVSESEIEEKKRIRQEEWEKVRKPDDPQEAPEEEYDPRSLFERLQEQKDKKQEEYEEQFKFKNMVKGLDEDESNFLDEVSRQQSLIEKQRRDEELQELQEYRSARTKLTASSESRKDPERRPGPKAAEHRSMLSQAHLLAGAVKRRSHQTAVRSRGLRVRKWTVPNQSPRPMRRWQELAAPLWFTCRRRPSVWASCPGSGRTPAAVTPSQAATVKFKPCSPAVWVCWGPPE